MGPCGSPLGRGPPVTFSLPDGGLFLLGGRAVGAGGPFLLGGRAVAAGGPFLLGGRAVGAGGPFLLGGGPVGAGGQAHAVQGLLAPPVHLLLRQPGDSSLGEAHVRQQQTSELRL